MGWIAPAPKSINSGRLRTFSVICTSFKLSYGREQSYISILENIVVSLRKVTIDWTKNDYKNQCFFVFVTVEFDSKFGFRFQIWVKWNGEFNEYHG